MFAGEGKQYKKEGLRTEMYFKKRIRLNSSQRANLISLYIGVLLSDQRNNGTCRDHNFFVMINYAAEDKEFTFYQRNGIIKNWTIYRTSDKEDRKSVV